jgi:hypothetical protein
VRAPSPRLHAWQEDGTERKKESSASVSTEGQITGGGRLRQEVLEEGLLVPSDVPDGLTNPYQRVRNSGTV